MLDSRLFREGWEAISHVIEATTDEKGAAIFECPYKGYGPKPEYWFPNNQEFLITDVRVDSSKAPFTKPINFGLSLYIGSAPYIQRLPSALCEQAWYHIAAELHLRSQQNFCAVLEPKYTGVQVYLNGLLYRRTA